MLKTVPLRKTRSLTPLVSQEADADSDQDDDGEDAEGDSGGEGVADAAPRFVVRRTGTQLSLCLTHQAEFNNAQLLRCVPTDEGTDGCCVVRVVRSSSLTLWPSLLQGAGAKIQAAALYYRQENVFCDTGTENA